MIYHDKVKADKLFTHHHVHQVLLNCWTKYNIYLPKEIPSWVVTGELIDEFSDLGSFGSKYKDLLVTSEQRFDLKPCEQLENYGRWIHDWQLLNILKEDIKRYGFRLELTDIEKCLLETPSKLISKIYKVLLQW